MQRTLACLAGSTAVALFAFTGVANASTVTLGVTTPPTGSTLFQCFASPGFVTPDVVIQLTQDPTTPYFVPAGGGMITSWSTNTIGDTAGARLTFVVLSPKGHKAAPTTTYSVVGADTETLPNPLPVSGVASFDLSTPIAAKGGDTLGLYDGSDSQTCYFAQGSTPAGDSVAPLLDSTAPAAGQTLSTDPVGPTHGGYTLDVGATLVTKH
jgi:hypothetical protein